MLLFEKAFCMNDKYERGLTLFIHTAWMAACVQTVCFKYDKTETIILVLLVWV